MADGDGNGKKDFEQFLKLTDDPKLNWLFEHVQFAGFNNLHQQFLYIFIIFRLPSKSVSYLTHLFGAFAGLLVGIGVLRNLEVKSWEKKLWWMAVGLYVLMIGAGIVYHVEFYNEEIILNPF